MEKHRMKDGSAALKEKPQLDDDELRGMIEERLDDDPGFRLRSGRRTRFEVEVDDGEVILRGVVRTALERRKADIIARALGATTVDNRLGIEENDAPRTPRRRSPQPRG
jgi:osmotically-inducible protein OsmY